MELYDQNQYGTLVLDSAPTGHLIRLLEMPELVDCWLKVFFGLFLKYKQIFRLPKVSQRLVEMSKALKRVRALLADPDRCALYGVAILTDMAFARNQRPAGRLPADATQRAVALPQSGHSARRLHLVLGVAATGVRHRTKIPAGVSHRGASGGLSARGATRFGGFGPTGPTALCRPGSKGTGGDPCVNSAPNGPVTFPCARPWTAS